MAAGVKFSYTLFYTFFESHLKTVLKIIPGDHTVILKRLKEPLKSIDHLWGGGTGKVVGVCSQALS